VHPAPRVYDQQEGLMRTIFASHVLPILVAASTSGMLFTATLI
jgi:hypothetical protein